MKNIIEAYIGFWVVLILLYICLAFTSINANIGQARNIMSTLKSEIKASNGALVDSTNVLDYDSSNDSITLQNNGYQFTYKITRQSLIDSDKTIDDSTFRYNSVYKVELKYKYVVPLFGRQTYPISTLVY